MLAFVLLCLHRCNALAAAKEKAETQKKKQRAKSCRLAKDNTQLKRKLSVAIDNGKKKQATTRANPREARAGYRAAAKAADIGRKARYLGIAARRNTRVAKCAERDRETARKFYDGIKKRKELLSQIKIAKAGEERAKHKLKPLRQKLEDALNELHVLEDREGQLVAKIKDLELRPAGPRWLTTMHKDNRVRNTPYPPGCILLSTKLMCDRLVPASQVGAVMKDFLRHAV